MLRFYKKLSVKDIVCLRQTHLLEGFVSKELNPFAQHLLHINRIGVEVVRNEGINSQVLRIHVWIWNSFGCRKYALYVCLMSQSSPSLGWNARWGMWWHHRQFCHGQLPLPLQGEAHHQSHSSRTLQRGLGTWSWKVLQHHSLLLRWSAFSWPDEGSTSSLVLHTLPKNCSDSRGRIHSVRNQEHDGVIQSNRAKEDSNGKFQAKTFRAPWQGEDVQF